LNGLMAVRIAWVTAVVVCAVVIPIALATGTGGGEAAKGFPGFAFSSGRDHSDQPPGTQSPGASLPDSPVALAGAVRAKDRGRASKGFPVGSPYGPGAPTRSEGQPDRTGGRTPIGTPRPKPPKAPAGSPAAPQQAPSVAPVKPPKAPPVTSPGPSPAPPETAPDPSPAPPENAPAPPIDPTP
jgi:hypothetical protein